MSNDLRRRLRRGALIALAIAYVAGLLIAPIGTLLRSAFADGLVPFLSAFGRHDVRHALFTTAKLTAIAVGVNAVFGTIVASVLVRDQFPGRRALNALVDVPYAVSPVIAGLVLIELFGRGGLLSPIVEVLGLRVVFALPGMAIATTFVTLPLVIREIAPLLEEIGMEQELAAYTLGASPLKTFFRVTLPSIRWGLVYGITLTAARAIGEFGAVLVVSGGVAGQTETATSFIHRALEDREDRAAHAVAVVLALVSIALLLLMEASKRRRSPAHTRDAEG